MLGKPLQILEYPDDRLTRPCDLVDLDRLDELQGLIDDMFYTMFFHKGVGLAAPQVGHGLRLFVIDQRPVNGNANVEPWVFVNPEVAPLTAGRVRRREGCLSFPGVSVHINRPEWVVVKAFDRRGEVFTMDTTGTGLLSQAVQHEHDHLEGVLMSDLVSKRDRRAIRDWANERG